MTEKLGLLSPSIVAALCAGGVFVCLGLIILAAFIVDIPKRAKRRAHTGIMEPSGRKSIALEISEAEKGRLEESLTDVASTNDSSKHSTRPASPDCTCEHPNPHLVSQHPPRI